MSAFVCVLERSGGTVDPVDLARLAAPLETGWTRLATFCRGPVGIVIQHDGGHQASHRHGPLEDSSTGRVVAVTGRFTPVGNEFETVESARVSCQPAAYAALALARSRDGRLEAGTLDGFLSGVSGAFVLIAADPGGGSIDLARDHLGSFKLYYRLDRQRLIAASEPAPILRHGTVSGDFDEGSIARFLGFRFGLSERSFFREVQELPPAHCLRVTANEARVRRYWRFGPPPAIQQSPQEITAAFRRRLTNAIANDVAGLQPQAIALSLSGGLDSTSLAALAPRGVRAFSWRFDNVPDSDERSRIGQVSRQLGLPVHWVSGDGLHPLCDGFEDQFIDEASPYLNPFSALKHRLYEAARTAGCERVLVGDGGDALFAAAEYWLRDGLRAVEPGVLGSLAGTLRRAVNGDRFARRALGRALLPSSRPRLLRGNPAPWLTRVARGLLGEERPSPILPSGGHDARYELSVGIKHSEIESEEQRLFTRCGVERGNPFWSWPLLELAIHLPAHWYHRGTRSKILIREALRGLLPKEVLEGGRVGLLGSFFLRGLKGRRGELRERVFRRPRSDWPRYVRRDWLERFLLETESITFGHTILWRVISYELWYRRLRDGEERWAGAGMDNARVQGGHARGDVHGEEIAGRVYGVAVRGRLPESFQPYLLPPDCGAGQMLDALEVSYRRIEGLPKVDEIWASAPTPVPSDDGRFALFRENDGFGLLVADQGSGLFRCGRRRIEIEWTAEGTAAPHYFFSYALPLWLEYRGVPVLHGSAVVIGDRAVGFVGPSGVGKSVLAAGLARLGCGLLADDGLVLRPDGEGGWLASSGPPLLRLWPSALRLLRIPDQGLARVHETLEKRQLNLRGEWEGILAGDAGAPSSGVRLAVLYVIERRPEAGSQVAISTVAPGEALTGLIQHSVAAAPAAALGLSARRFEALADVVLSVPVRRLSLPSGSDSTARTHQEILGDLERSSQEPGLA